MKYSQGILCFYINTLLLIIFEAVQIVEIKVKVDNYIICQYKVAIMRHHKDLN